MKATPPRQEWVTTIECVSAAGASLPPLVIFKGTTTVNSRWIPDEPEVQGWQWRVSNKGWSSDHLAWEWFTHVFEPLTCPLDGSMRLLVVDGHGSHIQPRIQAACISSDIKLMILPPHSSHLTQPLDRAVFGPLKTAMARETDEAIRYGGGRVSKLDWAQRFALVRPQAVGERNIRAGWKSAGLQPFAPHSVLSRLVSPPHGHSQLLATPLSSLELENCNLFEQNRDLVHTPIKNRITALSTALEAIRCEKRILEDDYDRLKAAGASQNRPRAGPTVPNVDTHDFTSAVAVAAVAAAKAATAAEKDKGKEREIPMDAPGPSAPNPFFLSV